MPPSPPPRILIPISIPFQPLVTDPNVQAWMTDVSAYLRALKQAVEEADVSAPAVIQARRSTTLALTSSFADVTFDETSVETDDVIIKHNDVNIDDFDNLSGETRIVKATYEFVAEISSKEIFLVQLRVNDTDPPVPGSLITVGSSIHNQNHEIAVHRAVFVKLTAGQKLTLQMDGDAAPNVLIKAGMTLLLETVD